MFGCGKKNYCADMCPQKDKTSHKDWAANKNKNPDNVTDDDGGGATPFAGVNCTAHVGVHENAHAQELKNIKIQT